MTVVPGANDSKREPGPAAAQDSDLGLCLGGAGAELKAMVRMSRLDP